jgi:hypothetical protein
VVSASSGYQASAGDWASSLGSGPGDAQFQIANVDGDGKPDLVGIYPSAGKVSVHVVSASSGYQASAGDWATAFASPQTTAAFEVF